MKKFISMVMAAAMVASLVPATAFAANGTGKGEVTATAKVVDADVLTKDEAASPLVNDPYPEIQLKVTGVDYSKSDETDYTTFKQTVEVTLDKAKWVERPVMGIRLDDSKGYVTGMEGDKFVVKTAPNFSTDASNEETALGNKLVAAAEEWWDNPAGAAIGLATSDLSGKDADAVEVELNKGTPTAKFTAHANSPAGVLKTKKAATATAKTAYETATPAIGSAADTAKTALNAAKAALQAEENRVDAAESDVRLAKAAVTTAEGDLDTARAISAEVTTLQGADLASDVLVSGDITALQAISGAGGATGVFAGLATTDTWQTAITKATDNVTAKTTALNTARANVTTKEADLETVKASVAANLPALKADVAAKQTAYDNAAKNDATVKGAKDVYDAAVADEAAAKKVYDAAKAKYKAAYDAYKNASGVVTGEETVMTIECVEWNDNDKRDDAKSWAKFEIYGKLHKDDVLFVDMNTKLSRTGEGTKATVSVDSDMCVADDLVFATVSGQGLQLSIRKLASVAEDEVVLLDDSGLKISSVVGDFNGAEIELKLSKGFEFVPTTLYLNREHDQALPGEVKFDGNTLTFTAPAKSATKSAITDEYVDPKVKDEFTLYNIKIEATSAKSGATASITAKSKGFDSAALEVAKVVDYKVDLSVDEDKDVPVIYSGVNTDNYGITDDSDHWSLEVTAEETFPGAWSFRKGFNFELPEGVHVIDVDVVETDAFLKSYDTAKGTATAVTDDDVYGAFFDAYQDGKHVNFEFDKRVFDDVDATLSKDTGMMTFKLQLTADPTFEGDVVLKLTGDLVDTQEVTIAKFVKPYTVKAEQNDLIIDYRYTDIPTSIELTEAEKGLWAKDEAIFWFGVERGDLIQFDDKETTFAVDSASGMEIDGDVLEVKNTDSSVNIDKQIQVEIEEESDSPATVTISKMTLFMQRNIPAGPYDLKVHSSLEDEFLAEELFAPDCVKHTVETNNVGNDVISTHYYNDGTGKVTDPDAVDHAGAAANQHKNDYDCIVDHVDDFSSTVKEAFVNVVTAGRDVDDASFTTKVVVPVGENYIIAGEKQVELDTPAYINEAGYTMLPIRAVATALGINNSNVLWDQPTKTVTILYGQRIITMTQGQKVVYVNGSAIPASAAVENTNSRTFLPMRDLATALGVTDITWDQATRTATLNGNQK